MENYSLVGFEPKEGQRPLGAKNLDIFHHDLPTIQPTQLYICADKLERVKAWFDPSRADDCAPLPIKRLAGGAAFTDGHTRALAAYLNGVGEIKVHWDEDDLDWGAYEICRQWCDAAGIYSIMDLEHRVISREDYEVLWIERCREAFERKKG